MDGEAKILPRVLLYLLRHHEGLASEEEDKEEGRRQKRRKRRCWCEFCEWLIVTTPIYLPLFSFFFFIYYLDNQKSYDEISENEKNLSKIREHAMRNNVGKEEVSEERSVAVGGTSMYVCKFWLGG